MLKVSTSVAIAVALTISVVSLTSPAFAGVRVSPLLLDIDATGRGRATVVKVTNETLAPLPVELYVYERIFAADGAETERAAEDDFLIFPPQAVINPGASQTVRIEWVSDDPVDLTRYFALHIDQPPIALSDTRQSPGSGLSFVVSFVAHIYVSARGAEPALSVEAADPSVVKAVSGEADTETTTTAFEVRNDGNRYALLQHIKQVSVLCRDQTGPTIPVESFRGEDLPDLIGSTLIRARESRVFQFPVPASMTDCAVPGVVIEF